MLATTFLYKDGFKAAILDWFKPLSVTCKKLTQPLFCSVNEGFSTTDTTLYLESVIDLILFLITRITFLQFSLSRNNKIKIQFVIMLY